MTWFIQQYLPQAMDLKTPEASVLFAESLVGLPPTVLLVAGLIHSVTRDSPMPSAFGKLEFRDRKKLEGMVHGFINQRDLLPQAREASQWMPRSCDVCWAKVP